MADEPYSMDAIRRKIVLGAVREVCDYREWLLLAVHVRSTHVHVILQATTHSPEQVMTTFKSYASRALNSAGVDRTGRKRWVRHGSTRYINTQEDLLDAMKYVKDEQGEPMAFWVNEDITLIPGRLR